jgi:hypothetical protein
MVSDYVAGAAGAAVAVAVAVVAARDEVKFEAYQYLYSQYKHSQLSSSLTPSAAFAKAMERYGFKGVNPVDIVNTGKKIREEIGETDQVRAAIL